MSWPFPPPGFKHPRPNDRVPSGPRDAQEAPF